MGERKCELRLFIAHEDGTYEEIKNLKEWPIMNEKFKVGDMVRFVRPFPMLSDEMEYKGKLAWILSDGYCSFGGVIQFMDGHKKAVIWDQVEPYTEKPKEKQKQPRTIVVRITDDGATAKYINGKTVEKEVEVKRFWKDKPSDRTAAIYAVGKLFGDTVRATTDESEHAEWASKTAEILRKMDWNDILFKAYVGEKK